MSSPAQDVRPPASAVRDALTDLALDLRWSFNHSADRSFNTSGPPYSWTTIAFMIRSQTGCDIAITIDVRRQINWTMMALVLY